MDDNFLANLVVWYVVFLFSTTLHEAAHSYVAAYCGDSTAYRAGSATLNPIPHMKRERMGMIAVPLISFVLNAMRGSYWMIGWASAPFNPYWAARYPKRSFLMSLAGPLTHIVPLGAAWLGMYIGLRTGFFGPPSSQAMFPVGMGSGGSLSWGLAMFLNVFFRLNAILLVFNLLPLPPLDGSEIWYLFMKKEEDRLRWRYTANSYSFAGLLVAWWLFPRIFGPFYIFLIRHLFAL